MAGGMQCVLLRILSPLLGPDLLHSLGLLQLSLHRLPVSSEICNAKKARTCLAGLGQQMIHILLLSADTDCKPLHETSPSVKPESGRMSRKKPGWLSFLPVAHCFFLPLAALSMACSPPHPQQSMRLLLDCIAHRPLLANSQAATERHPG